MSFSEVLQRALSLLPEFLTENSCYWNFTAEDFPGHRYQ
jgi:hypothetical protein